MAAAPTDRRYSTSHEWHKLEEDGLVSIGLTQFAVDELTDITYVEVSQGEGPVKAGEAIGEVESVKATSDIYCGIDGTLVAVNERLAEHPELLNEDPFAEGWIVKVKPDDPAQLDALLSAEDYEKQCAG